MQSFADSLDAHLEIIRSQTGYIVRFEVPLLDQPPQ
jgi:hypothetical protein